MRSKKRSCTICPQLQRLLTSFVVIWLVLFYPATCQYHGLLLPFGLFSANHTEHEPVALSPQQMKHVHQGDQPQHHSRGDALPGEAFPCGEQVMGSFIHHRTLPATFAAMTLLTMAMPGSPDLLTPTSTTSQLCPLLPFTHQHQAKPPDQPPRLLRSIS